MQEEAPGNLVGIFEDDGETGWLYLYDAGTAERGQDAILAFAPAYNRSADVQPSEDDVWVAWSLDFSKVAVLVRGGPRLIVDDFRAIIDVKTLQSRHQLYRGPGSSGIHDEQWLYGFEWTWTPESKKS